MSSFWDNKTKNNEYDLILTYFKDYDADQLVRSGFMNDDYLMTGLQF